MVKKIKQIPSHGVLFEYSELGVLLTGQSGIGKSDILLQLLNEGARLVCDDAPIFSIQDYQGKKAIIGCCDSSFSGLIHIRDLGVVDIASLYSHTKMTKSVRLQLIIHLSKMQDNQYYKTAQLSPEYEQLSYQGHQLQRLNLTYNPQRPMALLITIAINQFILKQQNNDPVELILNK